MLECLLCIVSFVWNVIQKSKFVEAEPDREKVSVPDSYTSVAKLTSGAS